MLLDEVSARLQAVLDAKEAVSVAQQRRDASTGWWAWITGRRPAAEAALRTAQADELSARTLSNTSRASHEAAEKALALMEESWRRERTRLQDQRRNQRQAAEQRLAWIEACAATLQTRPLLAR
ncbi:MAG: hypothetical protein P4M13_10665, partial [Alphaproteobacteria bacterium]|nr:hypothetical protein [Alphaproteobacteria bacterium]